MVQGLVRFHLGYSAQSGPLCERAMNVGGNERGALEAGVATKGSSPALEDLSWAVPFFSFLFMCPM